MTTIWMDPADLDTTIYIIKSEGQQVLATATSLLNASAGMLPPALQGWYAEELNSISSALIQATVAWTVEGLGLMLRKQEISADQSLVTTSSIDSGTLSAQLAAGGSTIGGSSAAPFTILNADGSVADLSALYPASATLGASVAGVTIWSGGAQVNTAVLGPTTVGGAMPSSGTMMVDPNDPDHPTSVFDENARMRAELTHQSQLFAAGVRPMPSAGDPAMQPFISSLNAAALQNIGANLHNIGLNTSPAAPVGSYADHGHYYNPTTGVTLP